MKTNKKFFSRTMLGLSAATLIAAPALANPFNTSTQSWNENSVYAEVYNAPRFKMTYRSLHTASVKRQKRAEMAAMELKRKNRAAQIDAVDRISENKGRNYDKGKNH